MHSKMIQTEYGSMMIYLPEPIDFSQVVRISKRKWYSRKNDYTIPPELLDQNSCYPCEVLGENSEGLALTSVKEDGSFQTCQKGKGIPAREFTEKVDRVVWDTQK